jgi:uncharacterized protein
MKSLCTTILFLWINVSLLQAQSFVLPKVDHTSFIAKPSASAKSRTELKNSQNEVVLTLYVLFDIYKNYFSSQDMNSCSFAPSCSNYGLQSIQKRGVVMGMIKTFDRLSRCHGFAPELYELDYVQRLQIDKP